MVLVDIMKQFLRPLILLASIFFMLVQVSVVFADGKSDPLSIVSEAERIIVSDDVAPSVDEVAEGQVEGKPEIEDQEEAVQEDMPYLIGPSDKLRVTVYGENDLSKVYQVDGFRDGFCSIDWTGESFRFNASSGRRVINSGFVEWLYC